MQMDPALAQALQEFAVSSAAGGIGGVVAGINSASNNSIDLIRKSKPKQGVPGSFDLGFVGDLLVGGAAGIAIVFFINIGITNNFREANQVDYLRLIPISLMAGVVSKKALAGMSEAVIGKLVSDTEQLRK